MCKAFPVVLPLAESNDSDASDAEDCGHWPLQLECAGVTCLGWTAAGAQQRDTHESELPHAVWFEERVARAEMKVEDVGIIECAPRYPAEQRLCAGKEVAALLAEFERGRGYIVFVLRTLLVAHGARSGSRLGAVIKDCISLCLPPRLKHMTEELVEAAIQVLPSPSTLSRTRMLLDGAMMLFMRDINRRHAAQGGSCRYMIADAS